MEKVGIDDAIAANGPEIVLTLLADSWSFDGHPRPVQVHLSEIENAELGRKRLASDVMVSAVGEIYLIPETLVLRCVPANENPQKTKLRVVRDDRAGDASESDADVPRSCSHCHINDGYWEHEIESPELLIDLTKVSSLQLRKRLNGYVVGLCPYATLVRITTRRTVTSFLATPKSRRLRAAVDGSRAPQDETGKPYREKVLFYDGRLDGSSKYYRATGVAVPNPKTQEATAFIRKLEPIAADHSSFELTGELIQKFLAFRTEEGGVWDKLKMIASDLTEHITQIFGPHRELSLLCKLLVYHSILQFRFRRRVAEAWMARDAREIGDTGQGKTQQVERIIQTTGLGESIDGVSTTRTGLAFAFLKYNRLVVSGVGQVPTQRWPAPFASMRRSELRPEDIDKIRKGRSDGKIVADGVRSGEHPTRTRLIMSCNPRYQGVVDDQLFGIELIKQTFKDEDIRRFDFAIISSSSDDKSHVNERRERAPADALISGELLTESIRWAWSRSPDDVVFDNDAVGAVYDMAQTMTAFYGAARDIPLVLESDIRHKVARIAVAIASLVHSTDEHHEKIIVTAEHVEAVGHLLTSLYQHPNCSFGLYARIRNSESRVFGY